jgi:hypothetical protein
MVIGVSLEGFDVVLAGALFPQAASAAEQSKTIAATVRFLRWSRPLKGCG